MSNRTVFFFVGWFFLFISLKTANAQSGFKSEGDLKKQAEKLFSEKDYLAAAPLYSELVAIYPKDPNYNYRYGICALVSEKDKSKPIRFLEFASRSKDVPPDVFFYLGKAYHVNYLFDNAITSYEKFKQEGRIVDVNRLDVDHVIKMCKNGKKVYSESIALDPIEQQEVAFSALYNGYNLDSMGGKALSIPPEFISKIDKKKQYNSSIYFLKDKLTTYFSSYGETDANGTDIFRSYQLPSMEWSKPENVGSVINTRYNEAHPFLMADGKTLYFCSEGHSSIGGLDIFRSVYNEATNTWSAPENLGYPINSTSDDIFYAASSNGEFAYFASNRETAGDKIMVYKILTKKRLETFVSIKGKFRVEGKSELKSAKITVYKETGELVEKYNTNPASGDYAINLTSGINYKFSIEAEGFPVLSEMVNIPLQEDFAVLKQEIELKKDDSGEKITIHNSFDVEKETPLAEEASSKSESKKDEINPTAQADKKEIASTLSNNDIVKIAFEDARQTENEAAELKRDAALAFTIAFQRDSIAMAKKQQAQKLLEAANAVSDPQKKEEELKRAKAAEDEAAQLVKEAEVAKEMAQGMDDQAKQKQMEADSSMANARALDESVRNDKPVAHNTVKKPKTQARKKTNLSSAELNKQAALNKQKAEGNLAKSEQLKKESDELKVQSDDLRKKAEKTADENEKQKLLTQADELESASKTKGKDAEMLMGTISQLQDSAQKAEMASKIAQEVENGDKQVKEQDSTVVAVAKETPVSSDLVATAPSDTLSKGQDLKAVDSSPVADNTNKPSISSAEPVAIELSLPASYSSNDPNFSAYSDSYNKAVQKKSSADSSLALSKKLKSESDSLATLSVQTKENAYKLKKKKAQEAELVLAYRYELQSQQKGAEADSNFSRYQRFSGEALTASEEAKKIAVSIPKADTTTASTNVVSAEPVKEEQVLVPVDKKDENTSQPESKGVAGVTASAETETSSESLLKATKTETQKLDDEIKSLSDEAQQNRDLAAKSRREKDKKPFLDKVSSLESEIAVKKHSRDSLLLETARLEENVKKETASRDSLKEVKRKETIAQKEREAEQLAKESETLRSESRLMNEDAAKIRKDAARLKGKDKTFQLTRADGMEAAAKKKFSDADSLSLVSAHLKNQAVQLKGEAPVTKETPAVKEETVPVATVDNTKVEELDKFDPDYSAFRMKYEEYKEKNKEAEAASVQYEAARNESDSLSEEAKKNLAESETKKGKDKKASLARATQLDAEAKVKKSQADSLNAVYQSLNEEANKKKEEANFLLVKVDKVKQTTPVEVKENYTANSEAPKKDEPVSLNELDKYDPNYGNYRVKDEEARLKKADSERMAARAKKLREESSDKKAEANNARVGSAKLKGEAKAQKLKEAENLDKESLKFATEADTLQAQSNLIMAESVKARAQADSILPSIKRIPVSPVASAEKTSAESAAVKEDNVKASDNPTTQATNKNARVASDKQQNESTVGGETGKASAGGSENTAGNIDQNHPDYPRYKSLKEEIAGLLSKAEQDYNDALKLENSAKEDSSKAAAAYEKANKETEPAAKEAALTEAKEYEASAHTKNEKAARLYREAKDNITVSQTKSDELKQVKKSMGINTYDKETVVPIGEFTGRTINNNMVFESNKAGEKTNNTDTKSNGIGPKIQPGGIYSSNTISDVAFKEELKKSPFLIGKNPVKIDIGSNQSFYDDNNPIPMDVPLPRGLIFKVQIGAFKNNIPQNTFKGIAPITGEKTPNGLTRFMAGTFIAFETANLVKKEIKNAGYKDAFVVAFYNGKRIPLYEAADVVRKYNFAQRAARKNAIKEEFNSLKEINIYPEKYQDNGTDVDQAAYSGTSLQANNLAVAKSDLTNNVTSNSLNYDGLVYTVQVGVYKSPELPRRLSGLKPVNREQLPNGFYRFTAGVYNKFSGADSAKKIIAASTVQDAFVIALYRGQRITVDEGRRKEKTDAPVQLSANSGLTAETVKNITSPRNIVFKVQVGAFRERVPFDIVDVFIKIKDKTLTNTPKNGLSVFYAGECKDFESADKLRGELAAMGLKDPFVVAFDGDKQIALGEALEILKR